MDTFYSLIKDILSKHLGTKRTFILLLAGFLWTFRSYTHGILLKIIPQNALLDTISGIILLLLVLVVLLISYIIEIRPKLEAWFNVLWDKEGNIYCNHCRVMLADSQINEQFTHYINRSSFQCPKCKQPYLLKDVNGDPLKKDEAFQLKKIGKKSKFSKDGKPEIR